MELEEHLLNPFRCISQEDGALGGRQLKVVDLGWLGEILRYDSVHDKGL